MREFVYYSAKAQTSGNFKDLMKAGRIDIVCNVIIQAFFLSHQMRHARHQYHFSPIGNHEKSAR